MSKDRTLSIRNAGTATASDADHVSA
jgi:hypothetical protein